MATETYASIKRRVGTITNASTKTMSGAGVATALVKNGNIMTPTVSGTTAVNGGTVVVDRGALTGEPMWRAARSIWTTAF